MANIERFSTRLGQQGVGVFSEQLEWEKLWEKKELLGKGSFGSVWRVEPKDKEAVAKELGISVDALDPHGYALKEILWDHIGTKKNGAHHLEKELEIFCSLSQMDHPNIMHCYKIYERENSLDIFLLTELLRGGDLVDVLQAEAKKRKISFGEVYSERTVACMAFQLVHAVEAIHRNNIMHRDIKLDNICLSDDWFDIRDYGDSSGIGSSSGGASSSASGVGSSSNSDSNDSSSFKCPKIKLVDFGLGKIVEQDSFTTTGAGTIEYSSPEVIQAKSLQGKYGHKVDVWSVGVTCWILLTGQPPFWQDSNVRPDQRRAELCRKIIDDPPPFHRGDLDEIGEEAQEFLCYCLIKDYDERPSPKNLLKTSDWLKPWTDPLNLANDDVNTPSFSNDPIRIEKTLSTYCTQSAILND